MEGKKNWRILVGVAMILCMAMPNRVEASEENSHMIPILETVWVEENGEQGSRMGVPQTSTGSGKTILFFYACQQEIKHIFHWPVWFCVNYRI